MVASNCNIETQIEMRDWTVGLFPEPLDVSHLDVGDELCLGGEYLVALEAVVRPGLPVDAGEVLRQVALPER